MIGSMFDGLEDATVFRDGGQYMPLGRHIVMLTAVKGRTAFKGESFIVEATLLGSTNPEARVGGNYSWVQKMEKKSQNSSGC